MEVAQIRRKPAVTCVPATTLQEAAWLMRDEGVGSVIVVDRGRLRGIATDRDIIVRGIAEGMAPDTPIGSTSTHALNHSPTSVLIVHEPPRRPAPLRVLLATDGSTEADHAAETLRHSRPRAAAS